MAPKKVQTYVKLQITAGKATPAPPVGPALGQAQVNIMEFCKQFNARTQNKEMAGPDHSGRDHRLHRPHVLVRHQDASRRRSVEEGCRTGQGSGTPNKDKIGKVTEAGSRHRHPEDARPERRLG